MKRFSTRAWRTAAVVSVGLMTFGLASFGEVAATPSPKQEICHATASHTNPYNVIDVDTSSIDELNNLDANGHGDHVGPVWYEGITVSWGDIIPPFDGPDDLHFPGLNWPEGRAIFENGCEIPDYEPEFGAIEVTKVVDAPERFENTKFEICVTPVGGAPICKDITGAGTILFDHLEPGAYVVTETDPGEHWTVVGDGVTVTVSAGHIETTTITNTRKDGGGGGRGQIWVTKVVEGEGAPSDITFQICVEPVVAEATTLAMSEEPHSHEPETCKTVSAGGVAKFEGLALGEYLITETDPGVNWHVDGTGVTVTVDRAGANQHASHTITNTWAPAPETGAVRVDKTVVRVGGDTTEFQICIRPAGDSEAEPMCTYLADAEEPHTFTGLLPGTYEVYEPFAPGWIVSVNPQAVVVVAGQTTDVTVTNTWIEQQPVIVPTTGSVALTKLVEGTPAEGEDIDGTFDLCLIGPAPVATEICRTVETDGGTATVLISGLLPGTYTVTEPDPGATYEVTISDETVTVVAGGLDAATITNTILAEDQEPVIPPVTPPEDVDDEGSDSAGPVPTPPTGALPHTGIELTLALIATATLGAGALLLTISRRRTIR